MQPRSADVLAFPALGSTAAKVDRPYVETSVARDLQARMLITHEERGIMLARGPWGIGKTTAIDAFAAEQYYGVVVVKVEAGPKGGASPNTILHLALEAMIRLAGYTDRALPKYSAWVARRQLCQLMEDYRQRTWEAGDEPLFTFIFDEAQYLSRDAIEMLRFWNDTDRTTTPFPVGLIFIGNNEFALQDDGSGQSVISGAVGSRALFTDSLDYADVSNDDLALFARSRGMTDAEAVKAFVGYFSGPRIRRDLRNVERLIAACKRRANDQPITAQIVRSVLNP